MDDSPPQFIVIRTPQAVAAPTLFETALDLVEQVHLVL